jgi:thioredoxin reductase
MQQIDVAVIGAGAAGCAAAYAAATSGAAVVLLDEQDAPGGWLRSSIEVLSGPPDLFDGRRGYELSSDARSSLTSAGVDYRPSSVVWGLFEESVLGVVGPRGSYQLKAGAVIVASGSTEIVWPFAGWTLPGVMTARAARTFMHVHRVLPGRRVAIVGPAEHADGVAADVELAGGEVVFRCDSPDGLRAGGEGTVAWVELDGRRAEVEAVLLALGSLPDPELARHALADLRFSDADGCHVPTRDERLQTSVRGLYVAGDAAGLTTPALALADGLVAGYAAAGSSSTDGAHAELARAQRERSAAAPIADPERIPNDIQVDREEQITAGQIRAAIADGAVSINDVKRRTRAGMGLSQGRDTEYVIARMIHARTGIPLAELLPMTARPPARLVALADLAAIAVQTA